MQKEKDPKNLKNQQKVLFSEERDTGLFSYRYKVYEFTIVKVADKKVSPWQSSKPK